jgi:hypothetical protein
MTRLPFVTLVIAAVFVSASAFAKHFAVGTCKPNLPSYSFISDAVSDPATANSIIEVCPGTYIENVKISQALTLQGVSSAGSDLVVINALDPRQSTLEVVGVGPVNISNIQVQQDGSDIGIVYANASGTLNHVSVASGFGFYGINVFVDDGSSQAVSIKNSNISMAQAPHILRGIGAAAGPGTLALTIQGNVIVGATEGVDIEPCCGGIVTATIQGNFIDGSGAASVVGAVGVVSGGGLTISGNTIVNNPASGISSSAGDTLTGNNLIRNGTGISAAGAGTYVHNTITDSTNGIDLGCNTSTATGNTFNNDTTAFNNVPSSFGTGTNSFYAVSAIKGTACP